MKKLLLGLTAVTCFTLTINLNLGAIAQQYVDRSGAFEIIYMKDKTIPFIVSRGGAFVNVEPNVEQGLLNVRGLTDKDLRMMGMNIDTFKRELKKQTGYGFVLLQPR